MDLFCYLGAAFVGSLLREALGWVVLDRRVPLGFFGERMAVQILGGRTAQESNLVLRGFGGTHIPIADPPG